MDMKERLKLVLDFRGLTAYQLSIKTGISRSSLCLYLQGKRKPKTDQILKIAKALNVSPAYLMGITDDMFYEPALSKVIKNNTNVPLLNEIEKNLLALDEKTLRMVNEMIKALIK